MARYVVVLGPSHGPLLFHTEYRILPSLPCTCTYIYPIPLTQSNMFWQRHEFAVFSKETTVAGRYIYIPSPSQFQPSLPPLPPFQDLNTGTNKSFRNKLHRESSIHAGMFFFSCVLLQLLSRLSLSVSQLPLPPLVLLRLVAHCCTFRA